MAGNYLLVQEIYERYGINFGGNSPKKNRIVVSPRLKEYCERKVLIWADDLAYQKYGKAPTPIVAVDRRHSQIRYYPKLLPV